MYIFRLARSIVGDHDQAEDVTQEVLIRVAANWDRVSKADNPDAYVTRIVTNRSNTWRRNRGREATPMDPAEFPQSAGHDPIQGVLDREYLLWAFEQLPKKQRTVLALRILDQRSDAEIASMMGISIRTVQSHASKATANLKGYLLKWTVE